MKSTVLVIILSSLFTSAVALASSVQIRIDHYSKSQLGKPYMSDPLGEAAGYDKDPLYRFDAFDCTTFVETILALSLSENRNDFLHNLNSIRYKKGEVSFLTRNHFTNIDWIQNNHENNLLTDVTAKIFAKEVVISKTEIDKAAWFKRNHEMKAPFEKQISNLPYLPITAALENPQLLRNIKTGSIINIVRPNWAKKEKIGTNLDVSHQGFAILKSDRVLYFRHASISYRKVTEEPLFNYLKRVSTDKTIGGINVLEINR